MVSRNPKPPSPAHQLYAEMLGEEEDEDAVSESGVCLGKHLRGSIRTPRPQPLHWVTEGIDGEGDGEYKRGVGEKNG